ncbi:hypothetical protein RIR_jg10336.t1 [Rhizophagus irregularis DAOM 181602=DAOM 197198]|nr:hypothetical protein RIR_jg10336.t1 [Rhizophagus irregularis DAOM 181602=DAOM 197198]
MSLLDSYHCIPSYFQFINVLGVITEQLQCQVQNTYDIETLFTFNEIKCEERIPDMKENEKNEKNDISSCYLESMLKFSFMSFYNRSSTNDTFYRTMRKNNFTDMDEESDDSEIEGSCNRLDFTELDESYSV